MTNDFTNMMRRSEGQGLVEYTLIVLLVALVFWVAVKTTNVGDALTGSWTKITGCLEDPKGCK